MGRRRASRADAAPGHQSSLREHMLIRASGLDISAGANGASARTGRAASIDGGHGGTMIDGAPRIPMPGASADKPRAVL